MIPFALPCLLNLIANQDLSPFSVKNGGTALTLSVKSVSKPYVQFLHEWRATCGKGKIPHHTVVRRGVERLAKLRAHGNCLFHQVLQCCLQCFHLIPVVRRMDGRATDSQNKVRAFRCCCAFSLEGEVSKHGSSHPPAWPMNGTHCSQKAACAELLAVVHAAGRLLSQARHRLGRELPLIVANEQIDHVFALLLLRRVQETGTDIEHIRVVARDGRGKVMLGGEEGSCVVHLALTDDV